MERPPSPLCRISLLAAVLLAAALSTPARGSAASARKIDARFSTGGILRGRRAGALQVDITNRGPGFEGRIRFLIPERREECFLPVKVPTQSTLRHFLPFHAGPPGPLKGKVELLDEKGRVLASAGPLQSFVSRMHCVLGVVGKDRAPGLRKLLARKAFRRMNVVIPVAPAELPELWEGLAPHDVLLMWGTDFRGLSALQVTALRNWVLRGGLLVAMTDAAPRAWAGSFVSATLQLELGEIVAEEGSITLSRFANKSERGPGAFERVRAAPRTGYTRVHQGTGPLNHLICHAPLGRGRVLFLAFDPCTRGLQQWKGLPDLWYRLLTSELATGRWRDGEPDWTQAEDFITRTLKKKAAPLPSVLLVVAAILFYGFLIGPFEYFLWKSLKRHHLTLISFPLLVILASGLAVLTTWEVRGREVTQGEVTVEDVDPVTGDSVWETYMGLYSPSPGGFRLAARDGGFPREIVPDELGLTGKRNLPAAFGARGETEVRLPVAGIRYFRSSGVTLRPEPPLAVKVKQITHLDEAGFPTDRRDYEVTVKNGLASTLSGCAVVSGDFHALGPKVFLLSGRVPPGAERTFESVEEEIEIVRLSNYLVKISKKAEKSVPDPRAVFPHLSFHRPRPGVWGDEELIRRGLHLGDPLHLGGQAFFIAWIEEEPLRFTGEGWSPQSSLHTRMIRMRIAESVALE
ncbi:MAG: hypothetical protein ACYS47_11475 [Planctomycetota bacterium]|jgi:hypothetical protein